MNGQDNSPSLVYEKITNVDGAINFVHSTYQFGSKFGLENMQLLLSKMGNPHLDLRYIHVAGTNGKGSTCAVLTQVLIQANYKVGTYVSPYLERFNERIQIDREPIADNDLAKHAEIVRNAIVAMLEEGASHPTEFEIVTAIGFSYYLEQAVDIVVLEVGLGGRLDSTNVIPQPLAAVITPIDYDHMQYLGNTLTEIASEKAGIIKGGLVVSAKQHSESIASISRKVAETHSELIWSDHSEVQNLVLTPLYTLFNYRGMPIELHLIGTYQVQNACTAIDTLIALNEKGLLNIPEEAIVSGVSKAHWAGRFERVHENPLVIIDGAHNVHGVKALKHAIEMYHSDVEKIAIFGMLRDKEAHEVLGLIAHEFQRFYTVVPDNPRALSNDELKGILGEIGYNGEVTPLMSIDTIREIVDSFKGAPVVIYCFGSLYYIGEVRKILMSKGEECTEK